MSLSNIEDWALCVHCKKEMTFKKMLAHVEVCPDRPLDFVLTAKGRRLRNKKRKH